MSRLLNVNSGIMLSKLMCLRDDCLKQIDADLGALQARVSRTAVPLSIHVCSPMCGDLLSGCESSRLHR